MSTQLSAYDYPLPEHLIAHSPNPDKGQDRLLVLPKDNKQVSHETFSTFDEWIQPDDILVFNNTKVIPARLYAKRQTGASCEVLLLEETEPGSWVAMIRNVRKISEGETLLLPGNRTITLDKKQLQPGRHLISFEPKENILSYLDDYGELPLPPYVDPKDNLETLQSHYQTSFASQPGAVAAPTAGLHFTPELIDTLTQKGIQQETITLHVGYGTFKPIETERITDHPMHEEQYHISKETAERLNQAKASGRRIIAIGTTVTRTLEAAFSNGKIQNGWGKTKLFIYPGYQFNVINGLLTNFHLPKSTLLCLVSALAGKERLMAAYTEAVKQNYRFFSFGDAMLIL